MTTVFVQNPGLTWMKVAFALYLVFSGSALWEYLRRDPVPVGMRSPLSLAAAAWMLGTVVLVIMGSPAAVGIVVGLALLAGGAAELTAWARFRREFIPARDQLWTGLVGALSGLGVLVGAVQGFGPHALLGIAGGGAIIVGVLMLISGLGFHHEVRRDRGTAKGL
nr:hypothetical protein [Micrococcus sp. ACRRV]